MNTVNRVAWQEVQYHVHDSSRKLLVECGNPDRVGRTPEISEPLGPQCLRIELPTLNMHHEVHEAQLHTDSCLSFGALLTLTAARSNRALKRLELLHLLLAQVPALDRQVVVLHPIIVLCGVRLSSGHLASEERQTAQDLKVVYLWALTALTFPQEKM